MIIVSFYVLNHMISEYINKNLTEIKKKETNPQS